MPAYKESFDDKESFKWIPYTLKGASKVAMAWIFKY